MSATLHGPKMEMEEDCVGRNLERGCTDIEARAYGKNKCDPKAFGSEPWKKGTEIRDRKSVV